MKAHSGKSGKQQRNLLITARRAQRSSNARLVGDNTTVADDTSHDFRIASSAKDLFTVFHTREAQYEVNKRIESTRQPLQRIRMASASEAERRAWRQSLDVPLYRELIPIPMRPAWEKGSSAAQQQESEAQAFEQWLAEIYAQYPPQRLCHFEHNLAVWKQLWNVCEQSDVCIMPVDARHPLFHFQPSLYQYITQTLGKPMILLLNKIDYIDSKTLAQWLKYFERHYPHVTCVPFSCLPHPDSVTDETLLDAAVAAQDQRTKRRERKAKKDTQAYGIDSLLTILNEMQREKQQRVESEHAQSADEDDAKDDAAQQSKVDAGPDGETFVRPLNRLQRDAKQRRERESVLVVGICSQPNVGKSSVINALSGRPAVSVSETPGRSKHLQTVIISPQIHLLDSPGLVLASVDLPRPLQVLCAIFPIAQLREPYTSVEYVAERVPLETIYGLSPPVDSDDVDQVAARLADKIEDDPFAQLHDVGVHKNHPKNTAQALANYPWSAYAICEAYARLRNYTLSGSKGRFDTHRAANDILHDVLHGVIVLNYSPPQEDEATQDSDASESVEQQSPKSNPPRMCGFAKRAAEKLKAQKEQQQEATRDQDSEEEQQ